MILTYRMVTAQGQAIYDGMEFPVVFRDVDGAWRATQNLREDEMLAVMPWSGGPSTIRIEGR